jgi:DNA topoisomerase VI subunit B
MNELKRTTFETSRAAEYFDARELQAQTGQPASNFATVALKELMDNALDACETAGVAPEVGIEVREEEGLIRLSVSDNGSGIPLETVRKVLNFDTRTSDKAAYRSPTRGAQGNALKTVIGIPHALGCQVPVVIEAQGIRHAIRAWVDPAGELRVDRDEGEVNGSSGTQVGLAVPRKGQDFDPDYWARSFALFNPHASVRIRAHSQSAECGYQGKSDELEDGDFYHPTIPFPSQGFRKFLPTDLTSPHWYSVKALERLLFSYIADARNGGRDLPLREFVRQFRGLSGTQKAKVVVAGFPGMKYLSDFEKAPGAVAELLVRMREESKAPSHDVLGVVGEEHFRVCFEEWYGAERFWYTKAKGETYGTPYLFEVAVAQIEEVGDLFTAVNFSPTFDDPLAVTKLESPEFAAYGIKSFLSQAHASPYPEYYWEGATARTAVAVHLVTPAPVFLDRGKTRLQLEG